LTGTAVSSPRTSLNDVSSAPTSPERSIDGTSSPKKSQPSSSRSDKLARLTGQFTKLNNYVTNSVLPDVKSSIRSHIAKHSGDRNSDVGEPLFETVTPDISPIKITDSHNTNPFLSDDDPVSPANLLDTDVPVMGLSSSTAIPKNSVSSLASVDFTEEQQHHEQEAEERARKSRY
jgi:hypothetical protein